MDSKSALDDGASAEALSQIAQQREMLIDEMRQLASRYDYTFEGKPRLPTITKLLATVSCEQRALHLLHHSEDEPDAKFDPVYGQKSEYATTKILDHLKSRLSEQGFNTAIATEVKDSFGVYDITISRGNPLRVYQKGVERIIIEVKASLGLPLEQLERYLWEGSPLILARVVTGHVVKFRPSQQQEFVLFSLRENCLKAKRLLAKTTFPLPGLYCSGCPVSDCPHARPSRPRTARMVKMNDKDFGEDLSALFANLPYVAERTAALVIEELDARSPSEGAGK